MNMIAERSSKTGSGNAASVRFDQVSKRYGKLVTAVDQISFTVEAGQLVTLLGPSGCGKTTTLRLIAGLEMLSSGRILIGDEDVSRLPATDRDVSMVFQSYALFPHMSVSENVAYGLRFSGFKGDVLNDRTREGLELVGLGGYGDRMPSELSGGQQQRVAVARALVLEPQVLLFDEPLSNLDAKLRRQVREEIRDIQQKLGLTVVYVTHDQEEALAVSDRIIVMNEAVIAQEGTPRELYDMPASEFVADFVGEANILDVEIVESNGDVAVVRIGSYERRLTSRGLRPGPARLAVRPSRVVLSVDPAADGFDGVLNKVTYAGDRLELTIETVYGPLFATSGDVDAIWTPNSNVRVAFDRSGPVLLPA